jgi:AcrR family transcriptional regulator
VGATATASSAEPARPGRPPKISRRDVVAAAVDLADEAGLEGVTIRGVAARLGVAPMTLYGHVAGAEELVDLVVGATIAAAVDRRPDLPADGRSALVGFARGLRDLLREHPAVLEVYRRRPVQDPTGLAVTEAVVAAMVADGLDDDAALGAYAAVYAFVVGFVSLERRPAEPGAVDLEAYPSLQRARGRLPHLFDEAAFERGLAALVDAALPPTGGPPAEPARPRRRSRRNRS